MTQISEMNSSYSQRIIAPVQPGQHDHLAPLDGKIAGILGFSQKLKQNCEFSEFLVTSGLSRMINAILRFHLHKSDDERFVSIDKRNKENIATCEK
jgi:hypothetical protein